MNAFVRRLQHGALFTDDDRAALAQLTRYSRHIKPDQVLVQEGEPSTSVMVMLEGWACRWKVLRNGLRQITDLILPGDMDHPHPSAVPWACHSVTTLSACSIADIPVSALAAVLEERPSIRRAVRWSTLQADSILRESLINNGRRHAPERIAHVICEVIERLRMSGAIEDEAIETGFPWPMTQIELSDLTAMTTVHANRTVTALRRDKLITLSRRIMAVPSRDRLAEFCGFQPNYVQMNR